MYLPEDLWQLIYAHRASMTIQRCARCKHAARLHYGHVHDCNWLDLRRTLENSGFLRRIYPFPLARREWRTEMESWCQGHVDFHELARDMEEHSHWGKKSHLLPVS